MLIVNYEILCIGLILCTKKHTKGTDYMQNISDGIWCARVQCNQNKNCSESGFISGRSQLWDLSCQELFTSSIYMIHNCSQPQIKHHKKVKIKHRTYLIFYFEIPYSLYTRTFAETLSTKAAVNFQNILHIFPQQKDKSQCKLYCSAVIFGWG